MREFQEKWRSLVAEALRPIYDQAGQAFSADSVTFEVPPKPEMGDQAFPMFAHTKILKTAPPLLAKQVAANLDSAGATGHFVLGPYVNVRFEKAAVTAATLSSVLSLKDAYGRTQALSGARVMLEFSSPNTNKPLHIGHLRNNALGESTSRILKFNGAEVQKVNLINDRGVHICKSMLAYQAYGQGKTPATEGVKSDRFVGDYYVKFAQWAESDPAAEEKAQDMLRQWEAGDATVIELWKKMNTWALDGVRETYKRQGIAFDRLYYESETYKLGKDEVLKGLEMGVFRKREDGAVVVDLPWKDKAEDESNAVKVLLRSDGTSIYMTQDLGTAINRQKDWPFNQLVYVVASEQDFHFKVLFHVLKLLGYDWAQNLFHLSYGMVKLPDGSKIKSRSGTTADADDILNDLADGASQEITAKGRENDVDGLAETAEKIAVGALHYFLLKTSPVKDMIFNPAESLSFDGNTGPYLQYTGARISSILTKAEGQGVAGEAKAEKLATDYEWELVKLLAQFPQVVERAGRDRDPSGLANFTYDLAKSYNKFNHECPILNNNDPDLVVSRVRLCEAVLQVLKNAFGLLNIPYLRRM